MQLLINVSKYVSICFLQIYLRHMIATATSRYSMSASRTFTSSCSANEPVDLALFDFTCARWVRGMMIDLLASSASFCPGAKSVVHSDG